jgi:hypothetical protein
VPARGELRLAEPLDNATTRLYERIRGSRHNRLLIDAIDAAAQRQPPRAAGIDSNSCIVLVPGIFYKDYPHTGADGAVLKSVAASMSIPVVTIPVDGSEGLEAAADLVNAGLLDVARSATSIILLSLSKGSAEVRLALTKSGAKQAFHRVAAWISVSGLPLGTPSFENVLRNPLRRVFIKALCAVKGWKLGTLRELLRHRPDAAMPIPGHIMFVQVAAFPLATHLNDRRSRRLRRQLSEFGPNDGFALLAELAALPGYMYPVWGADHYLRGIDDLPARIAGLISVVIENTSARAAAYHRLPISVAMLDDGRQCAAVPPL